MQKTLLSTVLTLALAVPAMAAAPAASVEKAVAPAEKTAAAPHKEAKATAKHQMTKDEHLKELTAEKEKVTAMASKVSAEHKVAFDLAMSCANKWMEALQAYTSPDTRYDRSAYFAKKELKMAEKIAEQKAAPAHKAHTAALQLKAIQARFNDAKVHGDKFTHDNKVAFDAMMFCADEYLKALETVKEADAHAHKMLGMAMRYVNTAEMFAHKRVEKAPAPAAVAPKAELKTEAAKTEAAAKVETAPHAETKVEAPAAPKVESAPATKAAA